MLLDDFNRPNENPLSGNGQWGSWGAFPSDPLALVSNQVVVSTGNSCSSRWMTNLGAELEMSVRYAAVGGNVAVQLWLDIEDGALSTFNGYRATINDSEGRFLNIALFESGVLTDAVNLDDAFPVVGLNATLSFWRRGTKLGIGIDGVTYLQWESTAHTSAGQIAIGTAGPSDILDDFSVDISDSNRAPVIFGRGAA